MDGDCGQKDFKLPRSNPDILVVLDRSASMLIAPDLPLEFRSV
jgi:hypothetical protein